MSGLPESPMPIRSGARQRARTATSGSTSRQTRDDSGLPCKNTTGEPVPSSVKVMNESKVGIFFRPPLAGLVLELVALGKVEIDMLFLRGDTIAGRQDPSKMSRNTVRAAIRMPPA